MVDRMRVLDLFSGIGGFSLGLERAGMETIAFCEIDKFCQKVLKKHWPDVPIHDDITTLDGKGYAGTIDVICGGFPCQDISVAGYQVGIEGKRSGLWKEMLRLISEIKPQYAIMENVTNLISGDCGRWFGRLLADLASVGYDAEWHCIPASYVGRNHIRDRVWIVAYPNRERLQGREFWEQETYQERNINAPILSALPLRTQDSQDKLPEPYVVRGNDGISDKSYRIKAIGNSVVPQIPEILGKYIIDINKLMGK